MRIAIYIDNQRLDLESDETIELKSSVQDVNDITRNTTDFTRNFTVPASQNNNIIFKHYYDASIDNGFDARTKVNARIEIDSVVFRYGKISLLGAKVKQGKPVSYSIVFYGNLVNLVDLVGEDELNTLDLSSYNHIYNSTNVKSGLTSSLFDGYIVYPLLAKKQYYYNSNSSDNTNTNSLANIAYNGGAINGVRWSDLKPSIKLLPIIEAIETKYGFTFTRDFFGRTEFSNIYLWLNSERGSDTRKFSQRIDFDGGDTTWVNLTTDTGTFTAERGVVNYTTYYTHILEITPASDTAYTVKTFVDGVLFSERNFTGYNGFSYNTQDLIFTNPNSSKTYTIYFEVESEDNFVFTATWTNLEQPVVLTPDFKVTTASSQSINGIFDVSFNMPKIKIIDFLKGLFQMFKLVVIQENQTDPIYVNSLNSYYASGILYDLTEYIDKSELNVERGKLLNTISYNFEDPNTILNKQFKTNVGLGYGDEEAILEDEIGNLLDGDKQEIDVPFEQVVYEKLIDLNDSVETNIQYGAIIDENAEPTNVKAHLHYVYNSQIGTKTVSFINDSEAEEQLNGFINLPIHTLGITDPQYSLVFGKEINEFTGETINNTLYSNYHSDYITSIFNIKRRNFKLRAFEVPYRILMKLRLKDVIKIRDDFYRINSFTYNLMNNKISFDLINSFDNTLNAFVSDRTFILTDYQAKTESIFVTNLNNFSLIFNDVGYGTSWISYTSDSSNIYFAIEENLTGMERSVTATVTDTDTLQEITVIITQTAGAVTFDNTEITFDNDLITWDNG